MPNIHQYNQYFLKELSKLNENQRTAVTTIEGPVLVIAGPGTGKTHILASRIGRILMETDTQAHNLLCLTFTDAGVTAMRNRLLQLIGPEAHRVHIFTFHSFCNNIIRRNWEQFGIQEMELLSDLERIEIVQQLLERLPYQHPLIRGKSDIYYYNKHLQELFKRMKTEDWSVALLNEKIDTYLAQLPERDEFKYKVNRKNYRKGEPKTKEIVEETIRMERLRAAVALYPSYLTAMHELHRYDYDDMILWVLRAFEENENLLRNYQEQYLYLLIDEYQDTNGAQNNVLKKLMSFWENPNIFIVGDDDQAIYEFQGAQLKSLVDFYEQYEQELTLVVLKENYRSSQHILEASRAVISENKRRVIHNLQQLGVDKHLIASNTKVAASVILPKVIEFPNRLHEMTAIVQQIETLQKSDFPLNQIAVIYAKHKQAKNLVTLLDKKAIPYYTKKRVNILETPLIKQVLTLLQYIQRERLEPYSGEDLLFELLHYPFFNIKARDLARMSLKIRTQPNPHWRELIGNVVFLESLAPINVENSLKTADFLEKIILDSGNLALPNLIERLINQSGLLNYVLSQSESVWYVQIITTFFDFVQRESDKNVALDLTSLLRMLHNMRSNDLEIPLEKTIDAGNGVQLLTAHSAKGLEFQYVFILDAVSDAWEKETTAFRQFKYPDTLTYELVEDHLEARRRLFYVATTRAKEHLYLSYSRVGNDEKKLMRTQFIDELLRYTPIQVEEQELSRASLLQTQALMLTELLPPQLSEPDKGWIDSILANFKLTITTFNQYLDCPLSFYYQSILKMPSSMSESGCYGIAMHHALGKWYAKMQASRSKTFPKKETLLRFYQKELDQRQNRFSPLSFQRYSAKGRYNLSAFYDQYADQLPTDVRVELALMHLEIEGIPVEGRLDLVEISEQGTIQILDYKTGKFVANKVAEPSKKQPYGGIYWRQLAFYKLLFEAAQLGTVHQTVIHYLELDDTDKSKQRIVQFKPASLALIKTLIKETYEKITLHHDFYQGCGKDDCKWCALAKQQLSTASFADEEGEELDD
jgi:DNA helicase II / ATP-dependent DNA helicase PcrA